MLYVTTQTWWRRRPGETAAGQLQRRRRRRHTEPDKNPTDASPSAVPATASSARHRLDIGATDREIPVQHARALARRDGDPELVSQPSAAIDRIYIVVAYGVFIIHTHTRSESNDLIHTYTDLPPSGLVGASACPLHVRTRPSCPTCAYTPVLVGRFLRRPTKFAFVSFFLISRDRGNNNCPTTKIPRNYIFFYAVNKPNNSRTHTHIRARSRLFAVRIIFPLSLRSTPSTTFLYVAYSLYSVHTHTHTSERARGNF